MPSALSRREWEDQRLVARNGFSILPLSSLLGRMPVAGIYSDTSMASFRVAHLRPETAAVSLASGFALRLHGQNHCKVSTYSRSNKQRANSEKSVRKRKQRLDELCQERYPSYSRSMIQSWILQGKVLVDGQPIGKAGAQISSKSDVTVVAEVPKYVCRAGYKLEAAIQHFGCDVSGKVALDAGLSTGGFTDCLLQAGAECVYGVDVGYGQVAEKIRTDKRVKILERTNLRYLSTLPQLVDIVTLDLSFISILLVMPTVCALMKAHSTLIALIKPQFEARRSQVGGGGVVRDLDVHKEVLERVIGGIENHGFVCEGWIKSPLQGAEGNTEFLACFNRNHLSCPRSEMQPIQGS